MSRVSSVKNESHHEDVQKSLHLLENALKEKLLEITSLAIKINLVVTRIPR